MEMCPAKERKESMKFIIKKKSIMMRYGEEA